MELNQRNNEPRHHPGGDDPGPGGPGSLDALREQAAAFAAAGSAIIDQTLSGNSQAFLSANRQQGGQ